MELISNIFKLTAARLRLVRLQLEATEGPSINR